MAFTVVTIEGEGEEAEYVRLADDVIRRSNLYQYLCKKNWRSCEDAGRQRNIRKLWKARYGETVKEFKLYERQVKSLLNYQQKKVHEAREGRKRAEKALTAYKHRSNIVIQNLKKGIASKKPLEKYRDLVLKNQRFFEQEYKFRGNVASDLVRAEMMLRTLYVYEKLKAQNTISYTEVMFLSLGTQLPAFRREDFEARFPDFTKHYMRDLTVMMDKGYVTKFKQKQQYYLTGQGKARFRELIGQIYNKQMGYYWKGLLEKL